MDFYRNTAIDVAGATFPSLVVECDAFVGGGNGDFKNDIIVKPDVITSTVATDEFHTEDYYEIIITQKGHRLKDCEWMIHSDPQVITK